MTPENQPPEPKHAFYGPSTLKYRALCAGWKKDEGGDQTAADEGTMLHLAVETGVLPANLTDEQRASVEKCLKFLAGIETPEATVYKEKKLVILGGLTFGTADRIVVIKKDGRVVVYVVDYKFGVGAIDDADVNLQGFSYVLGAFTLTGADEVHMVFLIPRRDEVLTHTFTKADIPRLELAVSTIIGRCDEYSKTKDDSLLTPCVDACTYCGRITCPKRLGFAVELTRKYAPLEVVDDVHSSEITDPVRMAKAFTLARVMEKWADSVKKHALKMVLEGQEIPGFELGERAGSREITNPILAYPILKTYLDELEIIASAKISLSKMEKFISEKAPKGQKAKKMAEFNTKLLEADCVSTGEPTRFLQKVKV